MAKSEKAVATIPADRIESRILLVRGQKVILDSDLTALYDVPTKRLNEQIRRDIARLPPDFMFRLTDDKVESLRSQFATSKEGRGVENAEGQHVQRLIEPGKRSPEFRPLIRIPMSARGGRVWILKLRQYTSTR